MAGRTEEFKGSVKETAGRVFGNEQMEAEGKADRLRGKTERHAEGVKDSVAGTAKAAAGKLTGDEVLRAEGNAQHLKGKAERVG